MDREIRLESPKREQTIGCGTVLLRHTPAWYRQKWFVLNERVVRTLVPEILETKGTICHVSSGQDSATPTLAELFCLSSRTLIRVCFRVSSRFSSDGQLRAGGIASSLLELSSRTRKYNTNTRWDKFELGA